MKHIPFTRILSLMLALLLVLGAVPAASASTLPELSGKQAVSAGTEFPVKDILEAGGSAPLLNGSLSDYYNITEKEPNNNLDNAMVVKHGYGVLGSTKSSDQVDLYKVNLTQETHFWTASVCNSQTMLFAILDSKGNVIEICSYYGVLDGFNVDYISALLPAGTYYIMVQQSSYGGETAYAKQVDYVIEFHAHTPTSAAPTGDQYNKYHSYSCAYCGTVAYEECNYVNYNGTYRCSYCGTKPYSFVYRISGKDRIATSQAIANTLKEEMGVSSFKNVVVASASNFPDALTGSYLAAVKEAPILLTNPSSHSSVAAYISRNLTPGGTVYILGGTGAVSQDFEYRLMELGINYKRLSGKSRLDTNLEILYEAGMYVGQPILVCTSQGFADSLSASATGMPILLVDKTLTADQRYLLSQLKGNITIIGGTGAVSASLESELRAYGSVTRLSGKSRYETSVKVAQYFFNDPYDAVLAYAKNYPDGLCGGPLAYFMGAPLILTDTNYNVARSYTMSEFIYSGYVLGGSSLVPDNSVRWIMDMNRTEPVPKK